MDNAKLLEQAKGPKVDSVEGTMLASAQQAEKAGDYNRAAVFYSQMAEKNADYKVMQGDALRRGGNLAAAQKIFDEILAKNPKDAAALEGKMLCRFAAGELAETADLMKQVLAIEPDRWRTLNVAGILFANRHMVDESMAYYERALTYSKDNPSILNNVGLTLAMDKQYDKAIQALTKAAQFAPTDSSQKTQVDMNLALTYGVSGDMAMAEKIASQHVSGPALYNNLGYYAKLAKNTTAARDYFNMALTKSPNYYPRAWSNLEQVEGKNSQVTDPAVKVKAGKPIPQIVQRPHEALPIEATPLGDADKAMAESAAKDAKLVDPKSTNAKKPYATKDAADEAQEKAVKDSSAKE